jgi:hypothetical protein
MVLQNTVLMRLFRPKSREVTGGWRNLHYGLLYNFNCFPSIMRTIELNRNVMGRTCCITLKCGVSHKIKYSELVQCKCMFRMFKIYLESITYSK